MCDCLSRVTNPRRGRDGHLEHCRSLGAKTCPLRPQHGSCHRNPDLLAGYIDHDAQRFALTKGEQARRDIIHRNGEKLGLTGNRVNRIHFDHRHYRFLRLSRGTLKIYAKITQ